MSDNVYYENRYSFWDRNKKNLSKIDKAYESFKTFEGDYFSNEKGVSAFFDLVRDKYSYNKDESTLYKTFACDLSWAKNTTFCGGSGGKNTTTFSWNNYPCVVELAKSKGISVNRDNSYSIGDIKYYPNGRKGNTKTKEKGNFTCNDAEFKTSNTGGSSNTGGGEITKGWVKDPTGNTTWEYQVRNCNWIAKKIGDKTEYNISKNAKFASSVKKLNKAYPSLISDCVGNQGNEKSAEYAKKFGQSLERAKSLMDKKIEYTPSDYRKFLTNPATNSADSTDTSAKPTAEIKPVAPEISGPVRTINPADLDF